MKAGWIWYPGDMEIYFALQQNFSRVERGYGWPAFWKSDSFRHRVAFRRSYELTERVDFTVYSEAVGFVETEGRKYAFGERVSCGPGQVTVTVHAGRIDAFPAIFIEGDVICSDKGWLVHDYASPYVPAGSSSYFTGKAQEPCEWPYEYEDYEPAEVLAVEGGTLFVMETELTAILHVETHADRGPVRVFCGESREEALDPVHCYTRWTPDEQGNCPCCALRYVFIPGYGPEEITLKATHRYVRLPVIGSYRGEDPLLAQIWKVAAHTHLLCSGIFFIDGIKRDKWIWCGDAYQSMLINQYLTGDREIEERTLLALRGNDPVTGHINTIVDYSLIWVLAVKAYADAYGPGDFLSMVWPKVKTLMAFVEEQLDEQGFLVGRPGDWIYIDWADFDKEGPFCPEQLLLARCYETMGQLCRLMGEADPGWTAKKDALLKRIERYFWDEEQSAYVDSYISGRRHVTRHSAILAILFDYAGEERKQRLLDKVLLNPAVPAITTPYFKFYELDALGHMGCKEELTAAIKDYWGGMLSQGAVTFWEAYDPAAPKEARYDMYGDRFGKSLCHAWGASPIYLISKYLQ